MGLRAEAAAPPLLVVFGGSPGVGKTTLARMLARRLGAACFRIDAIEQAIRDAGVLAGGIGTAGYGVANALAEANLAEGLAVVADCVNPVAASRAGWRGVAARAGAWLIEVEVICSDASEHRRRVETRRPDIPGLIPPDWRAVSELRLEPWPEPHFVIDTAFGTPEHGVAEIIAAIGCREGRGR